MPELSTFPSTPLYDRLFELQPARTLTIDGFTYIDKDKTVTQFQPPVPSTLTVATLSGFLNLLENGFEGFDPTKTVLHVTAFDEVKLIGNASDQFGRRHVYAVAKAMKTERNFKFNEFLPQEEFNIALLSMFVPEPGQAGLLAISGNLAKEMESRQQDDGVTQQVNTRSGVTFVKTTTLKPRVTLFPFRTFTEVAQPQGDFIFRVKHDERLGNVCALFEADAGAWKLMAMNTIKQWLTNATRGSSATSINNLPVVA